MDGFHDFDREMEAKEDLARYFERTTRYIALKAHWQSQKALKKAKTPAHKKQAIADIKRVWWLYGDILRTAIPLSKRVDAYRHEYKQLAKNDQLKPGDADRLWERIVTNRRP